MKAEMAEIEETNIMILLTGNLISVTYVRKKLGLAAKMV